MFGLSYAFLLNLSLQKPVLYTQKQSEVFIFTPSQS